MNISLIKITDEVYEMKFEDESVATSILLSSEEVAGVSEIIAESSEFPVSQGTTRCYNS